MYQLKGQIPQIRYGHTITPYNSNKLCLFGGAIGSVKQMSMVDTSFILDMGNLQWQKVQTTGIVPSARAGHAAACVQKNKIVIYGGATKQGLASDQLYILDLKEDVGIWNIASIRNRTPGKRYGHILIHIPPYLVIFGGNIQNKAVNDLWILNIQQKKLQWCEIKCKGDVPIPRDYHSAALCQTGDTRGMIIVFGGRSNNKQALNDCWGLVRHNSTGAWDWKKAPNNQNTLLIGRFQHTSIFVNNLMFIIGGRGTSQQIPTLIFNTETNKWSSYPMCDKFRHVSWYFKNNIYIHGGLSFKYKLQNESITMLNVEKIFSNTTTQALTFQQQKSQSQMNSSKIKSTNSNSRAQSKSPPMLQILKKQQIANINSIQTYKMLNQSNTNKIKKRIIIFQPIYSKLNKPQINKTLPLKQSIASNFLNKLLRPRQFSISNQFSFLLNSQQIMNLCDVVQQIIASQPILLQVKAPCKIFGDIHGQFSDLMEFFKLYGTPHENNQMKDIQNYDYIFLGDYVDRGTHSIQTICLLLSLKVIYPKQIHLLRGNHEDGAVNADFGFLQQCQMKLDQDPTNFDSVFARINRLFQWFPLAAIAQQKILCVHGGIGKGLQKIQQILQIKRPLTVMHEVIDKQSQLVIDILWSDPTQSDQIFGIHPNTPRDLRNVGDIVRFGPDRVHSFLKNNDLNLIIRAHQCVMDGIQRFAGGSLITVFSATDYGKKHKNAGGMLVLKTNLQIVPKIVYPKQKTMQTWFLEQNEPKRALTPPRWRKFN